MVQATGQATDRALEARVLEGRDPPARLADDVVMVVAAGHCSLVARRTLSQLNALNQASAVQQLERSIHAGDADSAAGGMEPVGDLLSAQQAVLALQQVNDRPPSSTRAAVAALQHREGELCPGRAVSSWRFLGGSLLASVWHGRRRLQVGENDYYSQHA
jgi:hypothetical protein